MGTSPRRTDVSERRQHNNDVWFVILYFVILLYPDHNEIVSEGLNSTGNIIRAECISPLRSEHHHNDEPFWLIPEDEVLQMLHDLKVGPLYKVQQPHATVVVILSDSKNRNIGVALDGHNNTEHTMYIIHL